MWIYLLGERGGADIKVGHSKAATMRNRIAQVNGSQTADEEYVLLVGMRGPGAAEEAIKAYFSELRRPDKGRRTEYFLPEQPLVEYMLWLRTCWWACFDEDTRQDDAPERDYSDWMPTPERRVPPPTPDPDKMIQDYEQHTGPLAGTAWSWVPDPLMSFQDYFTPPEIVAASAVAMGAIDLDAASHWIANRRLHEAGVDIGDYFTVNRSAFDHDWLPRTWLNPPYKENARWFRRAMEEMDAGHLEQLCWLSPVWAFTTQVAREFTRRSTATILLSPTPTFFNPGDPSKTGTNLPHAIFYWGDRHAEFTAAYSRFGIPCHLAWEDLDRHPNVVLEGAV